MEITNKQRKDLIKILEFNSVFLGKALDSKEGNFVVNTIMSKQLKSTLELIKVLKNG